MKNVEFNKNLMFKNPYLQNSTCSDSTDLISFFNIKYLGFFKSSWIYIVIRHLSVFEINVI